MLLKNLLMVLVVLLLISSCTTNKLNTLDVSPKIQLPQQDPLLMGITISINGNDQRLEQALAKINRNGQLVTITSSRDLRFLLQEALEKQMTARGYMIGPNGTVDLWIVVNKLYANVFEDNLRYNITTLADISIIAQAKNGNNHVRSYRSVYNVQGAFRATNNKITSAVDSVLANVINNMAKDNSINNFIKQNAR